MIPDVKSRNEPRAVLLIAVEDPGAANFVLELPAAFGDDGVHCIMLAFGQARKFLRDRSIEFIEYPTDTSPSEILDILQPQLLLAGTSQNPDSPILALIDEVRIRNFPALAFVDMAADANLRFNGRSHDPLKHAPDWLLVADRATEQAFLKLGFPIERLRRCGHPAYDRVLRQASELAGSNRAAMRRQMLGQDPAPRPVWLFAAEHGDADPRLRRGPGYTLHGRGKSDRRVDIVLEEVLETRGAMQPKPFIILRLHPKNTSEEFACYLPEVDMLSQGGDPLELIWLSDTVLGLSSILLMEAALVGRPTISIVPRECEREWSPSVTEGLTPCATTRDGLQMILANQGDMPKATVTSDAVASIREVVMECLGLDYSRNAPASLCHAILRN